MKKQLYIAEKPSVAQEFAKALKLKTRRADGYLESDEAVITWCVGHLVTMSYPEEYDPALKKWSLQTLPFIPSEFKYEVIPSVAKQFQIVSSLLNREDVDTIYVCTDSGREGEYIYRLVEQKAQVSGKKRLRVWIDSQTEEEILRGIREAKDLSEYDNLSASAYLRAKEDYLMGINFSRLLTLKYGNSISNYLNTKYSVISVGRVMTCVLGMVVRREREIREFVKTPFYRVISTIDASGHSFEGEWRAVKGSRYFESFDLYKENGFKTEEKAKELIAYLLEEKPIQCIVESVEKKKEKKNPPLLYNLAELQNDCSKRFKISPDEALRVVQELYEKKLVTYPRTDARVLSTAVAKEISRNLNGLSKYPPAQPYLQDILSFGSHKNLAKTRYVNDKQITDHYAIIPTGQGLGALNSLSATSHKVYDLIVRRFLSIFYPPAVYQKVAIISKIKEESFFSNFKVLAEEGYLKVAGVPQGKRSVNKGKSRTDANEKEEDAEQTADQDLDTALFEVIKTLKKGSVLPVGALDIKEGETSPPKRYNSGSIILAMENAGQLIEDEDLRAQIKGSGIGTSATRAEILKKLIHIKYLALNKKTQIITPTLQGEMVFDVVDHSIKSLLNPELTASWEKGLTYVAEGSITPDEYMMKLDRFITNRTVGVKGLNNQYQLRACYEEPVNGRKGDKYMNALTVKELYTLEETIAKDLFDKVTYPWEVLPNIGSFIKELGNTLSSDEYEKRGEDVWIAKSAKVAPTACINGPAIIGKEAEVRHCAFIRGNAIVGEGAVVGNSTELKNVVLFNKVQVPHYNYVGDSVLGYKSHMGAGSITSNVKSDKKLVVVKTSEGNIETGMKKFGAMLGDEVEVGCGSVLNPGTVVGSHSNIYPLSSVRGFVPANSIYKNKSEVVEKY